MRKTPLRRSPIARGSGPKPTRIKRKSRTCAEFARIYGSKARVAWIKALPCLVCAALHPALAITTAGASHNAHTVSGGKGRKADADTIVPLCAAHHRRYDEHKPPFDTEAARDAIKADAAKIARAWLAAQAAA